MVKSATNNSWFSFPKPNSPARTRLFCFPYAGGGVFEYRTWAHCLPSAVEVCAVQLPGREARLREAPYTKLHDLCETLAQAIVPYLDKPFAFFGHSLGAFITFELIRQLRRQNGPLPRHLFVSGSRAPQIPDPDPPVYHLPDADLIREVNQRYDGIPSEIMQNAEMLGLLMPALRADFEMNDTYVYHDEAPLDCPISCFGGLQDRSTPARHLEAWQEQTRRAFAVKMFWGDHFFLKNSRLLLLQAVSEHLNHAA